MMIKHLQNIENQKRSAFIIAIKGDRRQNVQHDLLTNCHCND